MNFGRQEGLRSGPCSNGHAWHPVAAAPGKPGYTLYHCRVCGEQTSMKATGEPEPTEALEKRVSHLERVVMQLIEERNRPRLPAPKGD